MSGAGPDCFVAALLAKTPWEAMGLRTRSPNSTSVLIVPVEFPEPAAQNLLPEPGVSLTFGGVFEQAAHEFFQPSFRT